MSLFEALIEDDVAAPPLVVREVYIALRTDGGIGATGSCDDPFDGSTATKFDAIMKEKVLANTTIHLGPGVFETQGGYANNPNFGPVIPWWPQSGQRIIGSGINATTLKLVRSNPRPDDAYGVVKVNPAAEPYLTGFCISDLTIDVNLQNQPNTTGSDFARVQCVAIRLVGRNLTVRRVRAINWGTRTESWEAFPISVSAGAEFQPSEADRPFNNIIEDCILELPIKENSRETTIVQFSGGENASAKEIFVQGCELRNCQVDCQFRNADLAPSMPVAAMSRSISVITVQTRWIHRLD